MADLFISYKREDKRVAERLSISLEQLGFDVWWDFELLSGDGFRNIIEQVIDECAATIVLWSELSRESTFVVDEASYSREQKKLCPARIDDCRLPLGFGGDHVVDLRGWDGEMQHDGLQNLIRAVEVKTGKKARLGARPRGDDEEARFAEMEAFKAAEAAGNVSALQSFVRDFPQGAFANFVRGQLETMGAEAPRAMAMAGGASSARAAPSASRARVAAALTPTRTEPTGKRKSSSWPLIVSGIAVAALAVIAFVVLPRGMTAIRTTAPPPAVVEAASYNLAGLNAQVRASVVQARADATRANETAARARAVAQQAQQGGAVRPQTGVGVQSFEGPYAGDHYAGQYADARYSGLGVYAWGENPNNTFGGLRVEGEFASDAPNGEGVYTWRDGKLYAGRLSNWQRDGAGVFTYADGRRYEGAWANDKQNGLGVEWDAQGRVSQQGVWTDGALTTPLS